MKIAARFLPNPAQAVGMGADVGVWSKEGLLDLAIACNMYGSRPPVGVHIVRQLRDLADLQDACG